MTVTTRAGKGSSLTNTEMDSNLNSLNWRHGGNLASASSVALTDEYNYFDITGTTTTAALTKSGVIAGFLVRMTFTSAGGVLTHNGTSFILPGSADITWGAGDTAVFVNLDGASNWKCIDYTLHSLAPAAQVNATALTSSLIPATDDTYDLGSASKQFRNLYIEQVALIDVLTLTSGVYVTVITDDTTLAGSSATSLVTENAVKSYVDNAGHARVTAVGRATAGVCVLHGDKGVSTITQTSTGLYTVVLDSAPVEGGNATVLLSSSYSSANVNITLDSWSTTTTFAIKCRTTGNTLVDPDRIHIYIPR